MVRESLRGTRCGGFVKDEGIMKMNLGNGIFVRLPVEKSLEVIRVT
jgi:hypothetical protein